MTTGPAVPPVHEDDSTGDQCVAASGDSRRQRWSIGIGTVVLGVVSFVAWGLGARPGDAVFAISQFSDRYHLPDIRFPGGAAAMLIGVLIVVLGVVRLTYGGTRRQRTWISAATALLFVLAFLSWAATGDPTNPINLTGLVQQTVVSAVPLVLGALAGIVCERSGVIDVAIEGKMLVGAFSGALFASISGSLGVGIVAAVLGGVVLAALLAVFAIRYLVNQVVLGVVLNALAVGLTSLGYHSIMQTDATVYNVGLTLPPAKIPILDDIPILGQAMFHVNIIAYITFALVIVVDVALFRSKWGLRTRAVGEHPKAAETMGIKVRGIRYRNVLIGGLIAGLAGAALTIGGSGQFNANISSGKGFIALAAVIFGRWSPRGAVGAALLFGFMDQLQISLSIIHTPVTIPSALLATMPYLVTVIAVAGLVGRVKAPAADGIPYVSG
jgi:ABC-type uncharacterized transport system permease subunit